MRGNEDDRKRCRGGPTDTDMDENWMLMTSGSEVKSIEADCTPLSQR